MLTGLLSVIDENQMEKLHQGVLNVLENTGLTIRGEFLLKALADNGCKVDFSQQRAWLKPDLVEAQINLQRNRYKKVRSSLWYPFCSEMPENDVCRPDEYCVDYGYGTPTIYDYPARKFRSPDKEDQIEMIKLGNALKEVKAICAPFICSEFDSRMEIIESSRILLTHTDKPGWVGTSSAREVKYLAEMAQLSGATSEQMREAPPIFVSAYCTTSPLKIDDRSCNVLEEAVRYKFPINFASMPILGATTPVTPAGSAIVAAAEILGGITAASLIAPDCYYYGTSISAEMDMKTTQICYASPAAILTDACLHQLFRKRYGLVLNVEPAYVEAKLPGPQAAFMKTFRQMAFGSTVSLPMAIGLLDNGSVFSPAQAMIDLDWNYALYKFGCGIEVNDESMALDIINELQFCEKSTYLECEHTFRHFKDILWDSRFMDRAYRNDQEVHSKSEKLLAKADDAWRELVVKQAPVSRDAEFLSELDKIVAAAQKELLGE